VRHGHADHDGAGRYWGQSDVSLTALGLEQAEKIRQCLVSEKIDAVYSSELKRTYLTAEVIATGRDLDVVRCAELNEVNFGRLEGLTYEEIGCLYPEVTRLWEDWSPQLAFPEGESFAQFWERVTGFTKRIEKYSKDETVLVVGHGGVFKLLLCYLASLGKNNWWKFRFDIGSISILEIEGGEACLCRLSDVSHLNYEGKNEHNILEVVD
jgi:alpha-ribazole phosphatase